MHSRPPAASNHTWQIGTKNHSQSGVSELLDTTVSELLDTTASELLDTAVYAACDAQEKLTGSGDYWCSDGVHADIAQAALQVLDETHTRLRHVLFDGSVNVKQPLCHWDAHQSCGNLVGVAPGTTSSTRQ